MQGVQITPEIRLAVVNSKTFFDGLKNDHSLLDLASVALTAKALGIGEATVNRIMAKYRKEGPESFFTSIKPKGRPELIASDFLIPAVRSEIRSLNRDGKRVTIDHIRLFIAEKSGSEISRATTHRALLRWGFVSGTGVRSANLKEGAKTIIDRRRYLRRMMLNREECRPEIYLDETYVNKNYSDDNTWFDEEEEMILTKPTGAGTRLIIINAIQVDGWVPGAKLVFTAGRKTGDYHGQMNAKNFSKWFEENLMPNIPDNSIIIMDNAAYHNAVPSGSFPQKTSNRTHLVDYLEHNRISWNKDMLDIELFHLAYEHAPIPTFAIDQLAATRGHSIVRTPPYHPELQPIETAWAVYKTSIARQNDCRINMKQFRELVDAAFVKVTAKTCRGLIKRTRKIENDFWRSDEELEYQNII